MVSRYQNSQPKSKRCAQYSGGSWLPGCASIRRGRPGWAEPEIYFRVVHVALDARNGSEAAYREQTVEIALGPKGAFENGDIGTLTRRVPANQVVSAIRPKVGADSLKNP